MGVRWSSHLAAGLVLTGGCIGELALPEPPSLAEGERAYDAPTATLSAATVETVVAELTDRLAQLDDLGGLRPVVSGLVRFDREVTRGEGDEGVMLRGVPLRTDAVVELFIDCPGWPGRETARDAVQLSAVVHASRLEPVLWGPIAGCDFAAERAGVTLQIEMTGAAAAYLPTILDTEDGPRRIYVTYDIRELVVNGSTRSARAGDFRLRDEVLELRIDLDAVGHVIAFGGAEPAQIGVRASNGEWRCQLDERRCERLGSSASFSY